MKFDNLSSHSGRVHLVPLTKAKLDTFKDLLGSREFGGCFCAVWTGFDEERSEVDGDYAIVLMRLDLKRKDLT